MPVTELRVTELRPRARDLRLAICWVSQGRVAGGGCKPPAGCNPAPQEQSYFNDALTFALYSSAFARIAASSSVRILASRTTGLPLTITSRTSSAFSA